MRQASRAWLVVGAAFLTLALGYAIRNSFSVFYPTIVDEFGWERADTALMFSLAVIVYGVAAPVAGAIIDRFEPRLVVPAGAVVVGAAFALCGLATEQWHFYLLYGVGTSVGLSIIGWTPLSSVVSRWFVSRRGLVFGVLGAGFGSSLISAPIAQLLIDGLGWQWAYVVLGTATTAFIVPLCGTLLRSRPSVRDSATDPNPTVASHPDGAHHASTHAWEGTALSLTRALRSRRFWLLFATVFCLLGVGEQILIVHQVYFFRDLGYQPMHAATMYTVFGIMFVFGNLSSYLSDRFGREAVFVPSCVLSAGGALLAVLVDGASHTWVPWAVAASTGLGVGLAGPVFFATVADLFQGRHFGSIQGAITLGFASGGALSPWAAGYLHDRTGSYFTTYLMVACALVAAGVLMWLVAPRKLAYLQRAVAHQARVAEG